MACSLFHFTSMVVLHWDKILPCIPDILQLWLVFAFSVKDIRACMTLRANTSRARKVNRYRSCAAAFLPEITNAIAAQGTCLRSLCNIESKQMPQTRTTYLRDEFLWVWGRCTLLGTCRCQVAGGQVRREPGELFTQVAFHQVGGSASPQIGNTHCTHAIKSGTAFWSKASNYILNSSIIPISSFPLGSLIVHAILLTRVCEKSCQFMGVFEGQTYPIKEFTSKAWHERPFSKHSWCVSAFTESQEFYNTSKYCSLH